MEAKSLSASYLPQSAREALEYRVGGLLYIPAIYTGIAEQLLNGSPKFADAKSIAFCLEDAIQDNAVAAAETELCRTFIQIKKGMQEKNLDKSDLPLIFVRIRNPAHMQKVHKMLENELDILTGFILPKYDLSNAAAYSELVRTINETPTSAPIFVMPILESPNIAYLETRQNSLTMLKRYADMISDYVLNIRVGGNDFNQIFGLRRSCKQSIYDIGIIRDIIIDILNVFSRDYVVSSPVWEYFDDGTNDDWKTGLENELCLDRLNGFIGKTAVHPSQIAVINYNLKVDPDDYRDAMQVVNWQPNELAVQKSASGKRMNEVKVHEKWAKRILRLAEAYGVKERE